MATGLLAIAMLRSDDAIGYLLERLALEQGLSTPFFLRALALYHHDDRLWSRVEQIARARTDRRLEPVLDEIG